MAIATLPNPRTTIAKAVRERLAGDFEAQHAEIWRDGQRWFSEEDAIWRVHADASMFIGAVRALLLQALHPVALQAVVDHAGFRRDFWGRFQRTSKYVALTTYGTVSDAERAIAIVRAIHRRVRGTTPDGTPYSADDPHLLMWVHVAEVDSFLRAFQAFGDGALTPADADEYVRQAGTVAARLGVIDPPATVAELKLDHGKLSARAQWYGTRGPGGEQPAAAPSAVHRLHASGLPRTRCGRSLHSAALGAYRVAAAGPAGHRTYRDQTAGPFGDAYAALGPLRFPGTQLNVRLCIPQQQSCCRFGHPGLPIVE